MVPTYPAPSSLVRSTLKPPEEGASATPFSISDFAFSYLDFSSVDISLALSSFNFFWYSPPTSTISVTERDFPGSRESPIFSSTWS